MLSHFLPQEIFTFMLAFCRFGTFFVNMPTIGENFINVKTRLLFALSFCLIIAPLVKPITPALPKEVSVLVSMVLAEMLVGFFLGMILRIYLEILSISGTIIAFHIGFSSATLLNPSFQEQGSVLSAFLVFVAIFVIYATRLHYLMIEAAFNTYNVFPIGQFPVIGDMANFMTTIVAQSFMIAVKISTPFIVSIVAFYVVLGVISKLAPQIQIFFISLPLQIIFGMFILSITLSSIFLYYLNQYSHLIANILPSQ